MNYVGQSVARVSVPKTHTFMLFLSIVASWLIKVYDKKPASFQWVEQNLKRSLSSYISPESVSDSFEFTISTLILWLCIYLRYLVYCYLNDVIGLSVLVIG